MDYLAMKKSMDFSETNGGFPWFSSDLAMISMVENPCDATKMHLSGIQQRAA